MTILGRHTINETLQYIKSQDFRFDKYNEAYKSIGATWRSANPTKAASLDKDWAAMYKKWKDAALRLTVSLKAQNAAAPLVSADNLPAESEWVEANDFFLNGKVPGGQRDCEFRINEAIAPRIVDLDTNRPLQNAPDTDIKVIKELDADIKAAEGAAAELNKKAGSAVKSNIGLILFGGAAVVGVAVVGTAVVTKVYL